MYYSLDDDHVRSMIALGMEHTDEGRRCGSGPAMGNNANSPLISRLRATASPPGGEAFKLRYPILKITIYEGDCHHAEEIQDRSRLRELRRQN